MLPLSLVNLFVTGARDPAVAEGAGEPRLLFCFGALAVVGALGVVLNVGTPVAGAMSLVALLGRSPASS